MSIVKLPAAVLLGATALVALPAAASAQGTTSTSPYPGPTTTVAPQPTVVVEDEGTVAAGDQQTYDDCGFRSGAPVSRSFNGRPASGQRADKDGCVHSRLQIRRRPRGQALGVSGAGFGRAAVVQGFVLVRQAASECAEVQIEGDRFPAQETDNRFTVQGTGANGAARTYTHVFDVSCPRSSTAVANPGDGAVRGALPRTGADLVRWGGAGVLLLGVGGGIVVTERRRLKRRAG